MMRTNILHTAAAATVLTVLLPAGPRWHCPGGCGPGSALAQADDPEVTRMAKEHFKLGLDAYTAGRYDQAIKELKKAYLLKRMPAILFNIALTYRKAKDLDMAVYFYKKFLQEAPPEDKQRAGAESALSEIEEERERAAAGVRPQQPASKPAVQAAQQKAASGSAAPAASSATAPAAVAQAASGQSAAAATEWSHNPIDAVPPSAPVDVRVQTPVMKGVKVKVFFRKEGQPSWDSLELKRRGNEKIARLPATIAEGRTFQYYIEARDPGGTLLKSSGSEASPNIVLIDPGARQQVAGGAEDAEADEPANRAKPGFSRDIENEGATFDLAQQRALDNQHQQIGQEHKQARKRVLGTLGWVGVGLAGAGVAAGGAGLAMYAIMKQRESDVALDSTCAAPYHTVAGGCPFYSGMGALKPSTASLDSAGHSYNTAWTALGALSLPLMVGGAALITYDVIKRQAAERAALAPPAKKKRKVKKVIEVEEPAALLSPVFSPTSVGLSAQLSF